MTTNLCRDLEESLTMQGFSKAYIRRLVLELEDHAECIQSESAVETSTPSSSEALLNQRLGDSATIAAAVASQPGLRPLTARFPWVFFLVAPTVCLFAWTVMEIEIGQALAAFRSETVQVVHWFAIMQWAMVLIPPALMFTFSFMAFSRVNFGWQIMAAVVLSMGCWFNNEIVLCSATQSIFHYPHWEFLPANLTGLLSMMVAANACGLLLDRLAVPFLSGAAS